MTKLLRYQSDPDSKSLIIYWCQVCSLLCFDAQNELLEMFSSMFFCVYDVMGRQQYTSTHKRANTV